MIERLKRILNRWVFYDKWRCHSCNREVFSEEYFCKDCEKQIAFNDKNICNHCGRALINAQAYCQTCSSHEKYVDIARSPFIYEGEIARLIKNFKYNKRYFFKDMFCEYMKRTCIKNMFDPDVVVYVPMTKREKRKRGFNQSKILAKQLSKIMNLPLVDAISKSKDTKRQATLDKEQRLKNLQDAFTVEKSMVKGKKVLIVDDVTTTGATAESIAKKLKKAGAVKVMLITVASVPSKDGY